jgi:ribosomal protein S18 acetylase RimI-like enzyme
MNEETEVVEVRPEKTSDQVLDNAPWATLVGAHAGFAVRNGRAARYQPDVAPFVALEDYDDPRAWQDLADLLGPDGQAAVFGVTEWPEDWKPVWSAGGLQMVGGGVQPEPEPEAVVLGAEDVPEILDLVARTEPGPVRERTIELGSYLGIRRDGKLIALAGERLRPPGWTEISAVCTDPEYRGQGLAGRLIRAVAAGIVARGDTPFLHVAGTNTNAIRLYDALGFERRRDTTFTVLARA